MPPCDSVARASAKHTISPQYFRSNQESGANKLDLRELLLPASDPIRSLSQAASSTFGIDQVTPGCDLGAAIKTDLPLK